MEKKDTMTSTRSDSKQSVGDLNQNLIFTLIMEQGSISRTDLARQSGLPAATITHIVGNFLSANLIMETTPATSSDGQRPILLSINPSAGYVAGVKLRDTTMTVAVCDLNCKVIHCIEATLPEETVLHRVSDAIAEAVKRCLREAEIPSNRLLGIGVGLSGLIDSARGVCLYSAVRNWHEVALGPALELKLRLPVRIDNDVNTLAIGERYFGAGRGAENFLLFTIGSGIGLGIVLRGEIYRGSHSRAGEFGHMTVDISPNAPLCNCGKHGCLEAIASDSSILRAATGNGPDQNLGSEIDQLINRARAGDEHIRTIFTHMGKALGIAIANLINIFDPSRILISGEGLRASDLFLESLRTNMTEHTFGRSRDSIDLVVYSIDETTWARGAASLILREVFQSPN